MRVAVIGAGIVGVTTAWALSRDGHEVVVFERRSSVAAENSFANAGLLSPLAAAWRLPALFGRHARLQLRGWPSGGIEWLWRAWRSQSTRGGDADRLRLQRLALYSREQMHALQRSHPLDYEHGDGTLVLFRSAREVAAMQTTLASFTELGVRHDMLDAAQCRIVEPGLSDATDLHGGLHLPQDEVGNCRQFTHLLRSEAERLGARFLFRTRVQRLVAGTAPQVVHRYRPPDDSPTLVMNYPFEATETQPRADEPVTERFDAVVVCAAGGSASLLRTLGIALPLQAVHGYSLTAPLRRSEVQADLGPRSALVDARYRVAVSRIGARVRVAGGAEIGGDASRQHASAFDPLFKVLHDWFPGSARLSQAQRWKGARMLLPDGAPVLGRSGSDGVWLNLAHGSAGWTLACGCAQVLADAIAGRTPAIDVDGLGIRRLKDTR